MPNPRRQRSRAWIGAILLQAVVWASLTVAFAALLKLAGPQSWSNALYFSGLNWMPWAVLAPVVFWFSGKFPMERGHLWRSVPAHVIACFTCVSVTLWTSSSLNFPVRPAVRIEPGEGGSTRTATDGPARELREDRPAPRPERLDRASRGGPRDPFGRRSPFWWPFLGATLLRANFDAAVYFIVVAAAHAMAFYRRAQERERHAIALAASLNEAKLDALRLQLHPHFLFNTLNAISTLVHRDATAADNLIGDLSELLRLSLQTAEHQVPLAREFELLDRYLAIEQARLGDRLRVLRDIDPATLTALVPTFLLQPLVENAIRHGLEPRLGPGTITLRAARVDGALRLTVSDDGVGLSGRKRDRARQGIGISNTEARLRALHGDRAQLALNAPPAGGVQVEICLPFLTASENPVLPSSNEAQPHPAGAAGNPIPPDEPGQLAKA